MCVVILHPDISKSQKEFDFTAFWDLLETRVVYVEAKKKVNLQEEYLKTPFWNKDTVNKLGVLLFYEP